LTQTEQRITSLLQIKTLKDQEHHKYRKAFKKFNFIPLCLYLPKGYYKFLCRKKLKYPVILNTKNKLEKNIIFKYEKD
jgi:hypothetical protein